MTPAPVSITRRRALFIGAAVLGAGAAPAFGAPRPVGVWTGQALGAHCTIELVGVAAGDPVFGRIEAEIRRLEATFSLYRADSALARLNRDGRLDAPPPELLAVLAQSAAVHRLTGGLFDPTVQPLFDLYARTAGTPRGPDRADLDAALARVGFDAVAFDPDAVRFSRPGVALTLNGIAQGYVTDRVADLLRGEGFSDMLLDIGEIRALGSRRRVGGGWRITVDGAGGRSDLTLSDESVATSDARGTVLDPAGRVGHIFHPRRGWVETPEDPVTVIAQTAALADALSTAAVLMDARERAGLAGAGVRLIAGART